MSIHPESSPMNPPHAKDSPRRPLWGPLAVIGVALVGSMLAALYFRDQPTGPRAEDRDLAQEAHQDLERRNYRPLSGPLEALLTDAAYKPVPTQAHPLLGQPAPEFSLADTDGKEWTLSEKLKEGPVVLVFYYGYNCNHCVSQLFGLHKDIAHFRELGTAVVAVSADPPELTRERYKKYGAFAFPVLSDKGNAVASRYGTFVPGKKPGEEGDLLHGTFVIDRTGSVVWANRGDEPFTQNRTLLLQAHHHRHGE